MARLRTNPKRNYSLIRLRETAWGTGLDDGWALCWRLKTATKVYKPLMRFLYSALFYCLVPLLLLRMLLRSRRAPAYRRRLPERFALFDAQALADKKPVIWVHAVSVGETIAAAPVIEALLQRYPGYRLVVTTTTPTGSERVTTLFGERVFHVYAPWDLPGATRRFLRQVKPQLLLIMETELWPNMIHYTSERNCRIVLANARMSARSAAGYARVSALTGPMLQQLTAAACQSQADAERLIELSLPAERLQVTGSIKFDLTLDNNLRTGAAQLRNACGERAVIVAASTHPGEDEQLLAALSQVRVDHPDVLLVLVPRHPERFDAVASLCEKQGFRVTRRSSGAQPDEGTDVYLGDTMGELLLLFGMADIAFVGGSLIEHGGHNVLEPAAWGVAVVTGPHMFNFAEISERLVEAKAMRQLAAPADLPACLMELLNRADDRQRMGRAALEVLEANRGARERLLSIVDSALPAD